MLFAHCALHMQCMDALKLLQFSNFKRYVLYSETSKFRGCRLAMQKEKIFENNKNKLWETVT